MVQKACPLLLRKPSSFTCSAPASSANAEVPVKIAIAKPRNRILMCRCIRLMMKDRDQEMNKEGPDGPSFQVLLVPYSLSSRERMARTRARKGLERLTRDLVRVVVDYSH